MATARAPTTFKKKDGILQLSGSSVTWAPAADPSAPSLTIPVPQISNLQATPASSAKVMIKIFATKETDGPIEQYVFTFTSPNAARAEADMMKEALTAAVAASKASSGAATPSVAPATTAGAGGSSAAMAITSAVSSKPDDLWNRNLENDLDLQKSLLESNPEIGHIFAEAVVKGNISVAQFWAARVHLLRAHAMDKAQTRGPYNVLATIKPITTDNVSRMSLSRDQIHEIFQQHPLVKTVYDENVPKLSEGTFWERFFLSRLFKKLKGEKILQTDRTDTVFDRYLNRDNEENIPKRRRVEHVPLTIDLEGNEQNVSQKRGNQPDRTMRPARGEEVPIIRTLNSLSQKLVDLVSSADDRSQYDDQDARYMNEQALADLQDDPEEERIILRIQDQRRFFSAETKGNVENEFAQMDPTIALQGMRRQLGSSFFDIAGLLPSGDDDAENGQASTSRVRLSDATKQVTSAVHDRRMQLVASGSGSPLESPKTMTAVSLVHATTNEFLHHFWLAFLSGDEKRAVDIKQLASSLENSKKRIESIAQTAEEEMIAERNRRKKEMQEEYKRTGIKPKRKAKEVGGGRQVVEQMLLPTITAVDKALSAYRSALAEAERMTT